MKTEYDCIPCILQQNVNYRDYFVPDDKMKNDIIHGVLRLMDESPLNMTPPKLGKEVYGLIKDLTGNTINYGANHGSLI